MRVTLSRHVLVRTASTVALMAAAALFLLPQAGRAERNPGLVRPDTTGARKAKAAKANSFALQQQNNQRVLLARLEKKHELKKLFRERGLTYPATETFIRIFKRERVLEVWVRGAADQKFSMLKSYSICALAGQLGPKRAQGDNQTPEGVYYIDGFNPSSDYHLSLHIDYPNKVDRVLSGNLNPGSNIFIHGGCKTEGCLAVNDDAIKELYWLSVESRNAGQPKIPVHIFPARLTDDALYKLTQTFDKSPELKRFWANLKPTYDFFEANQQLPTIAQDEKGRYSIVKTLGVPVVAAPAVKPTSN